MNTDKSPFDILGVSPSAELEVVNAAYRALARKYHPDLNPGVSPTELNRRMAEINWAKEELERDLEGWRKRAAAKTTDGGTATKAGSAEREANATQGRTPSSPNAPRSTVQVKPPVIILPGRRGSTATFTATVAGAPPAAIRARFKPGCLSVERLPPTSTAASFGVTVTDDFTSNIQDNLIETIEIVASGFAGSKVFVSIAPLSAAVLGQQYGRRIAPPRHASSAARISFGKHRSRMFQEIAVEEPGYLEWMLRVGAGSRVERESARLALNELRGGTWLQDSKRRARPAFEPTRQPAPPTALPDPHRPGGLWGAIKALFGRSERAS